MDKLKRYRVKGDVAFPPDDPKWSWCKSSDVDVLEATLDRVEKERDEAAEWCKKLDEQCERAVAVAKKLSAEAEGWKIKLDEANKNLRWACKALLEYIEYHAQSHPQYNGNRFDDEVKAKDTLTALAEADSQKAGKG